LEEIFTHNGNGLLFHMTQPTSRSIVFRYRSWFEGFLYLNIGDGGGAPSKMQ